MKKLKKTLAAFLVVLMLLTSVPVQSFTGIDLPDWFGSKAEALNVNYCSTAAAQWAIDHVYDYNSVLYNKGYWNDGGDCANFVSQCLYMGGMDMNDYWNISGYFCHWSEPYGITYAGSYVRCQQLYNYLVMQGAQVINNPSASDVSIGDVILYSREGASRMTHTAIVIDIKNGEPVVAAHSTGTVRYRSDDPYRDWHLNFKPERTYLMKLNGATCVNQNHKSFDVYVATGSDTKLYKSASTSSGYYNTFITGSYPDYAHVYKTSGNWGYTFRYGKWGWIKLNNFTYLSHQESPAVDHTFGDWKVVKVADCKNDGLDKRTCTRCGYEETRTTKGGHIIDPEATCLSGGFCKVCKAQVQNPLGHDWDSGSITTQPTCTEQGVRTYVCKRDSSHTYTEAVAELGHDYKIGVTAPTCTSYGESIYTCSRCADSYIVEANAENAWSDWTTDSSLASTLSSDRIQKKTQYRYKNREFTSSSSSSLSGWEKYDTQRTSWGATQGPVYSDPSNGSRNVWSESYHTGYEQKYVYKFYKYGASELDYSYSYQTSAKPNRYDVEVDYNPSSESDRPVAKSGSSYRWYATGGSSYAAVYSNGSGWVDDTSKPTYGTRWYYQEPVYTYYYRKWADNWSDWQDTYIAATDNRLVDTQVLYKYNLSELGHDWKATNDKEYINTNTLNGPDPCYVTGGQVCQRCALRIDPETVVNHDYPVFNESSPEWEVIADNGNTKVYRAYCRNGCGCYIEETTVECSWTKTVEPPTCEKDGYTRNECSCGEHNYDSDFVDALGHYIPENDEGEVIKPATCTEVGIIRHYCVRYDDGLTCSYYEDESIPPLGHEMTKYEAKTVTCTTDGNSEYYQCEICKKFYADENGDVEIEQDSWIIEAVGHIDPSEVEWVITDENGCGKTGWKKKYCNKVHDGEICGAVIDEEEIPEIPADYYVAKADYAKLNEDGEWVPTSCLYGAVLYWTCKNCEGTEKAHSSQPYVVYEPELIGILPHDPGDKKIIKEAYCIYPGQYKIYCNRCESLLEEGDIDAPCTEHSLVEVKADGGCVYNMCTNSPCTYIEGGEHNFQRDTSRDVVPTCIGKGLEAYTCTKCGETDDKELDPYGHDYILKEKIEAKCTEPGYEIHTCQRVNNGTVCGDEITLNYVNPIGHDLVVTDAVAPLCIVDGNFKYYTCQRDYCQKLFFDEEGHIETNDVEIIDPQIGHDMGAWYTNNDATHTRDCQRDNGCTYNETEGCTFTEWRRIKEPTIYIKGQDERNCIYCGYLEYRDVDTIEYFTVTFIAPNDNGAYEYEGAKYDVLEQKDLPYGTTNIKPPAIPEITGYVPSWESDAYNHLEDKDVVIKAVYTPIDPGDIPPLENDKTVEIENGVATITLSAVSDSLVSEVPLGAEPYDIILVLDQSSSMNKYNMGDKTRFNALKDVSKIFIQKVYDNALAYGVDHRIAVVGFAGKYNGSGLITPTGTIVRMDNNPDYANAFLSVADNKALLDNAITELQYETGTLADLGMEMAVKVFAENKNDEATKDRDKIVLFITDGVPGQKADTFVTSVADGAISQANILKNAYGATIYSIGVNVENADPTDETSDINKYLHAVSSNYPEAESMTSLGQSAKLKNFYLTADDEEALETIFDNVFAQQITNKIIFNSVTFYDTISKYYTLTTENEVKLRENVKNEYGLTDSDVIVTRNDDGTTTVVIKDITPKAVVNADGETEYYQAVVRFDVTANEETIAGGVYETNTEDAGIMKDGDTVIKFEIPECEALPSGRAIVKFIADGKVYAIREVAIGDEIVAPENDNLEWVYTQGDVVTDSVTTIYSNFTSRKWNVTWNIADEQIVEEYYVGQSIVVPQVEDKVDAVFSGWDAEIPAFMPNYELEFTAQYTEHEHELTLKSTSGDCVTGEVKTYSCSCGYEETEVTEGAHTYTATIKQENDECMAYVICSVCGATESHVLNYKAAYNSDGTDSKGGKNNSSKNPNTLSIDLCNNDGVTIQPEGYIYVRVYLEGDTLKAAKNEKLRIYRLTEDNVEEDITFTLDGNYAVLELDHFSYYVLEILGVESEDAAPTYNEAVCSINGHTYTGTVTAPTCTEKGYTTYTCACGNSYTDNKVDAEGHDMVDGKCTKCDFTQDDCDCICHSKSWFGKLLWKIFRFFYKLFRVKEICVCKEAHY